MTSLTITEAMKWPEKAIVSIYNPTKHRHMVIYSTNTVSYVMRLIQQLRDGTHPNRELVEDRDELRLEFLEDCTGIELSFIGQHKAYLWAQRQRKTRGDYFYSTPKKVELKTRTEVTMTQEFGGGLSLVAYVITARNDKFVIGRFPDVVSVNRYLTDTPMESILDKVNTYFKTELTSETVRGVYG